MGCFQSNDSGFLDASVTVVGLEGSGKSAIVHQMTTNQPYTSYVPVPTAGVEYSEIQMNNYIFRIYDCGGMPMYRDQWILYMKKSDAVCFVIDRTDEDRMGRVREEIAVVVPLCVSLRIPLLILVSKEDVGSALTLENITKIAKLDSPQTDWTILLCSAFSGNGIVAARNWLIEHIRAKKTEEPAQK
jgi:GTPase SAR1 family protein